jgi:uncharacterized membrane protein YeaQ/YmgE (transglycosylase-associated protein family)
MELATGELPQLANDVLVWIGYGTVIGLLAKAILPGRDPGGAVATLAMGIVGVVIGCGSWMLLRQGERIPPVSWAGLLCGTAGAGVILLFYRVLGGFVWDGRDRLVPRPATRSARPTYRRRRPYPVDLYEE